MAEQLTATEAHKIAEEAEDAVPEFAEAYLDTWLIAIKVQACAGKFRATESMCDKIRGLVTDLARRWAFAELTRLGYRVLHPSARDRILELTVCW